MLHEQIGSQMLDLFAEILEYPSKNPAEMAEECASLLSSGNPGAATELTEFHAAVQDIDEGKLGEIYTATFDLDAKCHPYVGYHLFGESYMRSAFLAELKERYRAIEFEADDTELPDRLSTVLRFVSRINDQRQAQEVINDALLPALAKILGEATDLDQDFQKEILDDGSFPVLNTLTLSAEDPEQALREEMVEAGFFPTLGNTPEDDETLTDKSQADKSPYWNVLQALSLVLKDLSGQEQEPKA